MDYFYREGTRTPMYIFIEMTVKNRTVREIRNISSQYYRRPMGRLLGFLKKGLIYFVCKKSSPIVFYQCCPVRFCGF
jgi:hypothetical protein